ncbi:hypothetical protein SAMN04487866_12233 [Thermoactinomyces sp. DSM 45891]|uniref:hypothetical protein n=1 Tax=Thermoactinomyces sp. DSM 45891 TaxID=1761907 RepID=UPI00092122F2|nr:hypothetical protein [Thermoactinomyces sp. DSM 45891]SFX75122.1 hypothetical protein SAMN04487866_12233 [Thermoactinomyces sp. DSM 45891]
MFVNKNILTYSLAGLIVIIVGLAISCSRGSSLDGSWSLPDKQSGCPRKYSFLKDNTVSFLPGRVDETAAGTYKKLESDKYKLDFGVISMVYEIKQTGNTMTVREEGQSGVCTYKRD